MSRFSDTLLDHARSPRNGGDLECHTTVGHADRGGKAPYTTLYLRIANGVVQDAAFKAFGCGVTIASCSALTTLIIGKELSHCRRLDAQSVIQSLDGIPHDKQFCADLAIQCLQDALSKSAEIADDK